MVSEGTLWHLWNFLQCIKYITFEFTPSTAVLCPPHPHSWIVSTGLISPFTYMCTEYFHHIHLLTPFLHHLPLLTGTKPPPTHSGQDFLWFCRRKKMKFMLIWDKGSYIGSFIMIFSYVCILTPIDSLPLFFFLLPSSLSYGGFKLFKNSIFILCIQSVSTIFSHLASFLYPTSLLGDPLFVWPVFHYIAVFVLGL
jgi:hypothetical protein